MPIVEVNGQELEFPDDMQPDAIKAVLQSKFPKPEPSLLAQFGDTQFSKNVNKDAREMASSGVKNIMSFGSSEPAWQTKTPVGKFLAGAARPFKPIYGATELYGAPIVSTLNNLVAKPVEEVTGSQTAGVLATLPAAIMAPSALKGAVNTLDKGASAVVKATEGIGTPIREAVTRIGSKPQSFNPVSAAEIMGKTYRENQKNASVMYKTVERVAKGKQVNTEGLSKQVAGLIDDIRADPFHEAKSALPKLEKLQSKLAPISENIPAYLSQGKEKYVAGPSTFDLADAVDLKRTMNQSFKGERWTQNAKGTVYGELGGNVDRILQEAAKKYPRFGLAKANADKYWLTNVENVFQGDDILKKFFRPEDMRALEALNTGRAANLPAETLARARAIVSKITNETELNAVRSLLPPDMAAQLSKEVIKLNQSGGRLQGARKLVGGAISTPLHPIAGPSNILIGAGEVLGGSKTPMQKALIEAAKKPAPRLYTPAEIKKMTPAQARAAIREMKGK